MHESPEPPLITPAAYRFPFSTTHSQHSLLSIVFLCHNKLEHKDIYHILFIIFNNYRLMAS